MFCISGSVWGAPLLLLKAVSCLRGPGSLAEARSCFAVTGAGVPVHCAGRGSQTARPVGAEPLDWPSYTQVHKKENMLALMSGSPRLGTGYSLRSGPASSGFPSATLLPGDPFHVVPEMGNSQPLTVPLAVTQPSPPPLQQEWWCRAGGRLPEELVSRAASLQEQLREN